MDGKNSLELLTKEELKILFNEVDKDASGYISNKELYDFLVASDHRLTHDNKLVRKVYKRADENGDGKLDFREFTSMVHDPRNRDLFKAVLYQYISFILPPKTTRHRRSYFPSEIVEDAEEYSEYHNLYSCCPPPIFMAAITVLEILLFAIEAADGHEFATGPIAQSLIYHPQKRLEMWRFLTYMLVHVEYMHLFMNVLIQIFLGVILEMAHGWWRVLLIYLAGVLAGSLGTSIFDPNVKLAGASGGVYSLITAHVATVILNWSEMRFPIPNLMIFVAFIIGDIAHIMHAEDTYIGHTTHLCGALAGLLVGVMILRNIHLSKTERILQWIALVIYIGLMSAAIIWNIVS